MRREKMKFGARARMELMSYTLSRVEVNGNWSGNAVNAKDYKVSGHTVTDVAGATLGTVMRVA